MDRPRDEWSSPRFSDEELDHFGELYVRCLLREAGVPFARYLENPEYYLQKHARGLWRGEPTVKRPAGLARLFRLRPSIPSGEG